MWRLFTNLVNARDTSQNDPLRTDTRRAPAARRRAALLSPQLRSIALAGNTLGQSHDWSSSSERHRRGLSCAWSFHALAVVVSRLASYPTKPNSAQPTMSELAVIFPRMLREECKGRCRGAPPWSARACPGCMVGVVFDVTFRSVVRRFEN